MKKHDHTVAIIVVLGLFLLTMILIVAVTPESSLKKPTVTFTHKKSGSIPLSYEGRAHIQVIDQYIRDNKATILSSALKENGYVVVRKEEEGKLGAVLGVSKLLSAGLYLNRSLDLTENVMPGDTLMAMIYVDDGDGVFDAGKDALLKNGETAMNGTMSFMVL